MPTIYTRRNYISFGQPFADDRYIATYVHPEFGGRRLLTTQPIEQLEAAMRWALEMADYMAGPIELVPIRSEEDLIKQVVVATAFEAVHCSGDPAVEADARSLLREIGVLKE